MSPEQYYPYLAVQIACAFWTYRIVERKGYNGTWWFVLGFFTIFLAVIGGALLPGKKPAP